MVEKSSLQLVSPKENCDEKTYVVLVNLGGVSDKEQEQGKWGFVFFFLPKLFTLIYNVIAQ